MNLRKDHHRRGLSGLWAPSPNSSVSGHQLEALPRAAGLWGAILAVVGLESGLIGGSSCY